MKQPFTAKQDAPSIPYSVSRTATPKQINWATLAYLLYALMNIIQSRQPNLSPDHLVATVNSIQIVVNGAHIVFGALAIWLAIMIHTRRNWVRWASLIVFLLAVLETLYAWSSPTNVPAVLPAASQIYVMSVQVIMLLIHFAAMDLVWFPTASCEYFAAESRSKP
jgi:hypothetical protein